MPHGEGGVLGPEGSAVYPFARRVLNSITVEEISLTRFISKAGHLNTIDRDVSL